MAAPVPRLIASAEELSAHPIAETRSNATPPGLPAGMPDVGGDRPSNGAAGGTPDDGGERTGEAPRLADRNGAACTPAQMRRFIKSRPWVPMHELRRRFQIEGTEDDVVGIDLSPRRVFVGLPTREGQILGDLLRSGEIGYELSLDPMTPIVIGVYPMRPVVRG